MKRSRPHALPPNLPPRGLSKEEAAEYLGLGVTLFDDLVTKGLLPEPIKAGARIIWDRHALDRAFEALPSRRSTAEPETETADEMAKALRDIRDAKL